MLVLVYKTLNTKKYMSPENRTPKHRAEENNIEVPKFADDDEPTGIPREALGVPQGSHRSPRSHQHEVQGLAQEAAASARTAGGHNIFVDEKPSEQFEIPVTVDSGAAKRLASRALNSATGADDLLNAPMPQQEGYYMPPTFHAKDPSALGHRK